MAKEISICLGTRGSLLAMTQSRQVAEALQAAHPGLVVDVTPIRTSGDRITDRPLWEAGGKGLFTREIELALLRGQIDLAVHSFKDVPVTMPLVDQSDLLIAAVPARQDVRDAMISLKAKRIDDLPHGAVVGTTSLRRRCQLLAVRPDMNIVSVRGNIDTRLGKLKNGDFDAVILAMAGLNRTNLFDPAWMHPMEVEQMLPAPGQGALALQCRAADERTRQLVGALEDAQAHHCVRVERQVVRRLEGDCHSPIAALAEFVKENELRLRVAVGAREGHPPVVREDQTAGAGEIDGLVDPMMKRLAGRGVHPTGPNSR